METIKIVKCPDCEIEMSYDYYKKHGRCGRCKAEDDADRAENYKIDDFLYEKHQ
jgi:predicted Zn-ribbon and HTH transcriptional regulator